MRSVDLNICGCVTYWKTGGDTDRQRLVDGLKAAGFEGFAPDPRTPYSALNLALTAVYGSSTTLIVPLDKRAGYEVVSVARGRTENDYEHVATALMPTGDGPGLPALDPPERYAELLQAYCAKMAEVPGGSVSRTLTEILKALGGISLKDNGGVYWVPAEAMARWAEVAKAVESSGGTVVCVLKAVLDENTVKAVTDGLRAEVLAEVERIETDILSGKLGERAITARTNEAVALKAKLENYEKALDTTLPVLRDAVDRAYQAAATGALLEAAGREAGVEGDGVVSNAPATV